MNTAQNGSADREPTATASGSPVRDSVSSVEKKVETDLRRVLQQKAASISSAHAELPDLDHVTRSATTADNNGFYRARQEPWYRRAPVPLQALAAAAALAFIAVGGYSLMAARSSITPIETSDEATGDEATGDEATADEATADEATTDGATGQASEAGSVEPAKPGFHLDAVQSSLPPGIDLVSGPVVFSTHESDPGTIALAYLTDQLSSSPTLIKLETVDSLTVYSWSVDTGAEGFLVVRLGPLFEQGVVAVTTSTLSVEVIERSVADITIEASHTTDGTLLADVSTVDRVMVATAPNPDGYDPTAANPSGTAGWSDDGRLITTMALDPVPVIVRLRSVTDVPNVGQRTIGIAEFAVAATGFGEACDPQSPLPIDVGTLLGSLDEGAAPDSPEPVLINQRAWHYPGDLASIEVRRPANPQRLARVPDLITSEVAEGAPTVSWTTDPNWAPFMDTASDGPSPATLQAYVLTRVGLDADDPCSSAEIILFGATEAVDWWMTALSGELSFGMPLTIAELDPTSGLNDPDFDPDSGSDGGSGGESGGESDGDLVVDTITAIDVPTVAATGSCDGLPDAGPKVGSGSGSFHPSPEDALAHFLNEEQTTDPPLITSGYTAYLSDTDQTRLSYVILADENFALTVVDVANTDEGWQVERWSGAAC